MIKVDFEEQRLVKAVIEAREYVTSNTPKWKQWAQAERRTLNQIASYQDGTAKVRAAESKLLEYVVSKHR